MCVTIDPNKDDNPLIQTDSIVFETNGNLQDVDLVAWGQDANYITPDTYKEGFLHIKLLLKKMKILRGQIINLMLFTDML